MNIFLLAILLASTEFALHAQQPVEIRYVHGVKVDLAPVISWSRLDAKAKRETERPMPHWKGIFIGTVKGRLGSWDHCLITNEQGQTTEILINNLPVELRDSITKLAQLDGSISALRAAVNYDRKQMLLASDGSTVAIRARNDEGIRNRQMFVLLDERSELDANTRSIRSSPTFAMFTGAHYDGLEIWDCGERR